MYGSASAFETYHEARGRTIPTSWSDAYIEAALLVASEWLDDKYGDRFYGFPTGGYTQERQWPRTLAYTNTYPVYVFATDEIPNEVVEATYEVAWREANEQGCLSVDFTPSKYTSVSVDGAVSVTYDNTRDAQDIQKQIEPVERMLKDLFDPSKYSSKLSGGVERV